MSILDRLLRAGKSAEKSVVGAAERSHLPKYSNEELEMAQDFLKGQPSLAKDLGQDAEGAFTKAAGDVQSAPPPSIAAPLDDTHVMMPEELQKSRENMFNLDPQAQKLKQQNDLKKYQDYLRGKDISDEIPSSANSTPVPKEYPKDITDMLDSHATVQRKSLKPVIAGAAGLGGLAYLMSGDNSQSSSTPGIPDVTSQPTEQTGRLPAKEVEPVAKKQEIKKSSEKKLPVEKVNPEEPIIPATDKQPAADNVPAQPNLHTIDFGDNTEASVQALKDAQEARNSMQLGAMLGKSGELLSSGLSGAVGQTKAPKLVSQEIFDQQLKNADQPVKDYEERRKEETNDPDSAYSKGFRDYLKQFGINVEGKASAANLEKIMPFAFKQFEADKATEAKKFEGEENRKSREAIAKEAAEARKFTASEGAKNRKALSDIRITEKEDQLLEKDRQKFGDTISFNKQARGNAAQIENLVNQTDRINTLMDGLPKDRHGDPDLNKITPIQKDELIRTFDTLLAGKSTVSGQQELMSSADSIYNKAAKLKQFLSGNKVSTNEGNLLKSIVDTVNREGGLAKEKIKDMSYENHLRFKRLKEKDPEFVNEVLKQSGKMDDDDIKLRDLGYKAYDINNLLNSGYNKEDLLKFASQGIKPKEIKQQMVQDKQKSNKIVVKKGYNPSTDQTQVIYSDGSKEIVQGRR